ncbi:hypothetical protein E5K00_00175 [Hymenobacter aquaticus]|uniref:DUF4369 domain-containing protein n=1 Tax=Hymenobacter aquaticus TaxID=1867101 RepID=A0A4Z0Q235_9BACT|nr:hypothetical protein [Hymenobacter aquaticus]TGE23664.1 hypothetical protein E5K00_00175 [Hymenobacter aquaticus]
MRFFLLLALLLFSHLVRAQFNSFEPGSYVLSGDPTVYTGVKLKLRGATELVAKNAAGQTAQFSPSDVSSFRLGQQKYVSVSSFEYSLWLGGDLSDKAFVQVLDSGDVMLMRCEESMNRPMTMGAGSGTVRYGVFLLRRANERPVTHISGNRLTGGGSKFRDAILPYLTQRPDLRKLVEEKTVTLDNIIGIVHALNTGQPYAVTAPHDSNN